MTTFAENRTATDRLLFIEKTQETKSEKGESGTRGSLIAKNIAAGESCVEAGFSASSLNEYSSVPFASSCGNIISHYDVLLLPVLR